jgi:chemotaxis protein CheZ
MTSQIRLDDAQGYLDGVIAALRRQNRPDRDVLVTVLDHISQYIQVTRHEISSLRSSGGNGDFFATASDELEEVVAEAARATNEIMSAAETIERLSPLTENRAPDLAAAVTRIYVACSFQDITGQRIAKVIRTLKDIEGKVAALATACGGEIEHRAIDAPIRSMATEPNLLNGPQLAGQAQSQDDIDKLLKTLS